MKKPYIKYKGIERKYWRLFFCILAYILCKAFLNKTEETLDAGKEKMEKFVYKKLKTSL